MEICEYGCGEFGNFKIGKKGKWCCTDHNNKCPAVIEKRFKKRKEQPIKYPRKCFFCDYLSNNPAMYSIHLKTHQDISENKFCDFGCGRKASFIQTSGTYICSKKYHDCPEYRHKLSTKVKAQWVENEWQQRRKQVGNLIKNESKETRDTRVEKMKQTKHNKLLSLEHSFDRKKYDRAVHYWTKINYIKYKNVINPEDLSIGRKKHHIDHKVSKFVGWLLHVPIDIISSPLNLQIIPYKENGRKRNKCSIHPLILLEKYHADTALIEMVKNRIEELELEKLNLINICL